MSGDLLLLIVSSPSGAGKTTLTRDLLGRFDELRFSVSHTTRKPRPAEIEGKDYHFTDPASFRTLVAQNAFAEWAEVHGNLYGTSLEEIERCRREGKRGIVFDIDHQGARQIRARLPDAISVFVLPPSMAALKERLRTRAADDAETIEQRFRNAEREIQHYGMFDYVIVNDDLSTAKQCMHAIVLAELSRRHRVADKAERLLREISQRS